MGNPLTFIADINERDGCFTGGIDFVYWTNPHAAHPTFPTHSGGFVLGRFSGWAQDGSGQKYISVGYSYNSALSNDLNVTLNAARQVIGSRLSLVLATDKK